MRYASICHCRVCGHRWKEISRKEPKLDDPAPPCPNLACGEAQDPIGMDLSLAKAPAAVGMRVSHKAVDETAKIVMEDYGMTDLRDDVRPTEAMAPKLPPQQQARADSFFGGAGKRRPTLGGAPINMRQHAAAALSGGLMERGRPNPIETMHRQRAAPAVHLVADDRALRR